MLQCSGIQGLKPEGILVNLYLGIQDATGEELYNTRMPLEEYMFCLINPGGWVSLYIQRGKCEGRVGATISRL